jgi:hypothetical protein
MTPTPDEVDAVFRFVAIWHLYVEGLPYQYGEPPSWQQVRACESAAIEALHAMRRRADKHG